MILACSGLLVPGLPGWETEAILEKVKAHVSKGEMTSMP